MVVWLTSWTLWYQTLQSEFLLMKFMKEYDMLLMYGFIDILRIDVVIVITILHCKLYIQISKKWFKFNTRPYNSAPASFTVVFLRRDLTFYNVCAFTVYISTSLRHKYAECLFWHSGLCTEPRLVPINSFVDLSWFHDFYIMSHFDFLRQFLVD